MTGNLKLNPTNYANNPLEAQAYRNSFGYKKGWVEIKTDPDQSMPNLYIHHISKKRAVLSLVLVVCTLGTALLFSKSLWFNSKGAFRKKWRDLKIVDRSQEDKKTANQGRVLLANPKLSDHEDVQQSAAASTANVDSPTASSTSTSSKSDLEVQVEQLAVVTTPQDLALAISGTDTCKTDDSPASVSTVTFPYRSNDQSSETHQKFLSLIERLKADPCYLPILDFLANYPHLEYLFNIDLKTVPRNDLLTIRWLQSDILKLLEAAILPHSTSDISVFSEQLRRFGLMRVFNQEGITAKDADADTYCVYTSAMIVKLYLGAQVGENLIAQINSHENYKFELDGKKIEFETTKETYDAFRSFLKDRAINYAQLVEKGKIDFNFAEDKFNKLIKTIEDDSKNSERKGYLIWRGLNCNHTYFVQRMEDFEDGSPQYAIYESWRRKFPLRITNALTLDKLIDELTLRAFESNEQIIETTQEYIKVWDIIRVEADIYNFESITLDQAGMFNNYLDIIISNLRLNFENFSPTVGSYLIQKS